MWEHPHTDSVAQCLCWRAEFDVDISHVFLQGMLAATLVMGRAEAGLEMEELGTGARWGGGISPAPQPSLPY